MKDNPISILISSTAEKRRESLKATLSAEAELKIVAVTSDLLSAINLVALYHPDITLIDSPTMNGQLTSIISQIKEKYPFTYCIVLIGTLQQQEEARAAGADNTLLKGFRTSELLQMVKARMVRS